MKVDNLPADVLAKAPHLFEGLMGVELPEPTGYFVLCIQWRKPDKTAGGIILTTKTHKEDEYQGRSGVVLAVGPDAYKGERYPGGDWIKPGDWVAWPNQENAAYRMKYADVVITALPDDRIILKGVDPERVS